MSGFSRRFYSLRISQLLTNVERLERFERLERLEPFERPTRSVRCRRSAQASSMSDAHEQTSVGEIKLEEIIDRSIIIPPTSVPVLFLSDRFDAAWFRHKSRQGILSPRLFLPL